MLDFAAATDDGTGSGGLEEVTTATVTQS